MSLGPRLGGSIGHVADVLSVLEFWAGFYDLASMSGFRCVGWVLCWCFAGFSGIMGDNLGGLFCCLFHFCEGGGGSGFWACAILARVGAVCRGLPPAGVLRARSTVGPSTKVWYADIKFRFTWGEWTGMWFEPLLCYWDVASHDLFHR